ncbi:MAG: PilZ domain-containing protein [Chakrabartia godavariana]
MHLAARLAVQNFAPDRRRSARFDLAQDATLAGTGFHGADVVVTEISTSGFRARLGRHIPPGSIIRLKMAGLGMAIARVVWSRQGEIGGAFVNPVSEQRVQAIVGFRRA